MKTKLNLLAIVMIVLLSACGPGFLQRWFRVTCYQFGDVIYEGEVNTTGSNTEDRDGNIVVLPRDGCIYVQIDK